MEVLLEKGVHRSGSRVFDGRESIVRTMVRRLRGVRHVEMNVVSVRVVQSLALQRKVLLIFDFQGCRMTHFVVAGL
jgi:hypothetical protein